MARKRHGQLPLLEKEILISQKILSQKRLSGMKYYMVEQDKTFDGQKPLDAIKISHDGLIKVGFKK